MRPLVAILAACVGCGGSTPIPDAGVAVDAGMESEAVRAHNAVRAGAMPAPSPALPPMIWSDSAAAVASAWAAQCRFEHNAARGNLGENIFASTGPSTATQVVNSWASEKQDYTFATNTCDAGKVCGHYTQIVWRSSLGLGCATQRCTTNNPFGGSGAWTLWVCDYAPPGNRVGSKPY